MKTTEFGQHVMGSRYEQEIRDRETGGQMDRHLHALRPSSSPRGPDFCTSFSYSAVISASPPKRTNLGISY